MILYPSRWGTRRWRNGKKKWIENHHAHIIFDTINLRQARQSSWMGCNSRRCRRFYPKSCQWRGESPTAYTLKWVGVQRAGRTRKYGAQPCAVHCRIIGYNPRQMLAEPLCRPFVMPCQQRQTTARPSTHCEKSARIWPHPSRRIVQEPLWIKTQTDPLADLCRGSWYSDYYNNWYYYQYDNRTKIQGVPKWSRIRVPLYDVAVKCGKMQNDTKRLSDLWLKRCKGS